MATSVSFNGSTYSVPASGERNWATLSAYLIAISTGALSKVGGSFTLTAADVDFGASFGLRGIKFASRNTPATTGIFRLGNNEAVSWRNAANSADLAFKVNASNVLEFNGNPLLTLALGTANYALKMNAGGTAYEWGLLANANIDAAAAIDWTKLAISSTVDATEIGYVNGVTSAIQTQLDAKLSKSGGTMTGDLVLAGDPDSSLKAATKQYVDSLANGVKWKAAVRAATAVAGTLATSFENGDTIDGVVLATGDRILIKDQAAPAENGIYVVAASGAPARASDADAFAELNSAVVMVSEGTANADRGFIQTATLTALSDSQTWVQNFGTGLYTASGEGLELSGTTFSLELDGTSLSKSSSGLKVNLVPIGSGGTGQITAALAYAALSPLTTKGDIQTYSSAPARLGVGGNGTVLMADSGETTGLKWATVAATVTTTRGDMIRRGAAADERFAAVTNNRVVRGNGTDVVSGQIDATDFFTTGAEVTQSAPGIVKSAGQLKGTNTNDSASSTYVGEVLSDNVGRNSPVALVNNTAKTIISVTLTAGDWDVWGAAGFTFGATTTLTGLTVGLSTTTDTQPSSNTYAVPNSSGETIVQNRYTGFTPVSDIAMPITQVRVTTTGTTLYLVVTAGFGTSTCEAYGSIFARRRR